MRIPFVGPSATGYSTNINSQRSINFFKAVDDNEAKVESALYGTPGLVLFAQVWEKSAFSAIRAMATMEGLLYIISGNKAFVYDPDTDTVTAFDGQIGTASGNVYLAANLREDGSQLMITDGSKKAYYIQHCIAKAAAGTLTVTADLKGRSKGTLTVIDTPLERCTFTVGSQTFTFVTQATYDAIEKVLAATKQWCIDNGVEWEEG